MATSDFWRELAARFRLIPDHGPLRADGTYRVGSGAWRWDLRGGATEFVRNTFETLASRGAFEIAGPDATDLLDAWLDALRKDGAYFHSSGIATEKNPGGAEIQSWLGSIDRVCEASATFCKKLEARALQQEFQEKQRRDPRNWSPLRSQFEALKAIKELRSGPHEQIPEALVRRVIAEELGIEPEEVTFKQIRLAVSDLLRDYPAITMVPTEATAPYSRPTVISCSGTLCASGRHFRATARSHSRRNPNRGAAEILCDHLLPRRSSIARGISTRARNGVNRVRERGRYHRPDTAEI